MKNWIACKVQLNNGTVVDAWATGGNNGKHYLKHSAGTTECFIRDILKGKELIDVIEDAKFRKEELIKIASK